VVRRLIGSSGEAGADTLYGGTEGDLLYGGSENDSAFGDAGADTIYGDAGIDTLYGGSENDLVYGGSENDLLYGDAGVDTLYGGGEDDLVYGGADGDLAYGGLGADTLYGDGGSDSLFGGDANDQIFGGLGADSIEAGDGTDLVYGGDANDTINFGTGDDTVYGGAGDDVIDDLPGVILTGVNQIFGGSGNDTIWSGNDADTIYGDEGNDLLNGEGGADLLFGGTDNDTLNAGSGNDVLTGGAGTDSIFGGDDRDEILVTYNATANDALGNESVDGGSGAGTSSDNDTLRVDITGFGWARINLVYDPLNAENGTITFLGGDGTTVVGTLAFTDIENLIIVCFTAGTQIMTQHGAVAVEDLVPGEMVLTRDNGMQPLRWVGRRVLSASELMARPELQPVRIGAGALGEAGPERSMMLSPQHRVLVEGARSEMYFGESEVLVPAKHLVGLAEVSRALPEDGVTYVHILFDRHEIVQSDGLWTESFQPAERTLNGLDAAARAEVLDLFPELASDMDSYPSARPVAEGA
jgi:Ca2+-binding RTX toxin-like protein